MSLPGRLGGSRRVAETKQPRLRARIGLHFQRRIVLPRDAQAPGQTHDAAGTVGATLLAGGFILRRIPALPHLPAFRGQRHRVEDALRGRDHPVLPVLDDWRHPVPSEIDWRCLLRADGRTAGTAAAAALRVEHGGRGDNADRGEAEQLVSWGMSVHDFIGAAAPREAVRRPRQVDHQHAVLARHTRWPPVDDHLVTDLQ